MPEFKLNGKTYSGSTSYASAIDYTEANGSKTTVQDKISELDFNISEQNKNLMETQTYTFFAVFGSNEAEGGLRASSMIPLLLANKYSNIQIDSCKVLGTSTDIKANINVAEKSRNGFYLTTPNATVSGKSCKCVATVTV